jgi:hypothetical protein
MCWQALIIVSLTNGDKRDGAVNERVDRENRRNRRENSPSNNSSATKGVLGLNMKLHNATTTYISRTTAQAFQNTQHISKPPVAVLAGLYK